MKIMESTINMTSSRDFQKEVSKTTERSIKWRMELDNQGHRAFAVSVA